MPDFLPRIALLLLLLVFAGCSAHDPAWHGKAQAIFLQLQKGNAPGIFPEAFEDISKTFKRGENLLLEEDEQELADEQFRLAYQKSYLLQNELKLHLIAQEEARVQALVRQTQLEELERQRQEAEQKRAKELASAQKRLQQKKEQESAANNIPAVQQVNRYTVKRGETLPLIASLPEVYSDAELWPLIYRANRDQIRDPYQLWPGQVLNVPRNVSKEELAEARRQAQRKVN